MANPVVTFLEHVGKDILSVFQKATAIAEDIEPLIAVAAPSLSTLYETVVNAIANAEALGATAASEAKTDTAKLANVLAAITPSATATLAALGVTVNSTHLTNYVNAVVGTLNAIPAPAVVPPAK